MVETIAPVVHGGRTTSYYSSVVLHTVGATLTAAGLGFLLGASGAVFGAPWGTAGLLAVAIVAAFYALRELARLPLPLPDLDRQVPDWWRTFFSPNVAAFLYGTGLGIGFLTYLSFGTLVPVAAAAFVSGDPLPGAALMAPFGAARGLSVLVAARRNTTPEEVVDVLGRPRPRALGRAVNGAALVAIGIVVLAAA